MADDYLGFLAFVDALAQIAADEGRAACLFALTPEAEREAQGI